MTDLVDLDNLKPEQVYSILGVMPKFSVGDRVRWTARTGGGYMDCAIEAITIQYGKITYVNDGGKWGYEDQYKALPVAAPVSP